MAELTEGEALAVGVGLVALGAVVLLLLWLLVRARRRRLATVRRLAAVVARLEEPGARARDERDSVSRLEHLAQATMLRLGDAEASLARLADTLAVTGPGVVICDDAGAVVYRNGVIDELLGEADESGVVQGVIDEMLQAGAEGTRASRSVQLPDPSGRSLEFSGHPLDDGQRAIGAVAVVDDVSQRHELDTLRQGLQANLTGELKAPLAALSLLAATLADEDDPAVMRRLGDRLCRQAGDASQVLDDVAELSRLESGAPPEREPVAVDLVVAQAVEAAHLPGSSSVTIGCADDDVADTGPTVTGDRRQLVLAVRHLIDHAGRTVGAGSKIRVSVGVDDGVVEVVVSADGPTAAVGERDRAVERLFRVADGGAFDPGGSGLGLAIASRVANAHGGQLVVESTPSIGIVVTLRVPAA